MAESKIAKNKIPELLKAVSADYTLYGPKAEAGIVALGRIHSAEELMLDYRNSTISAKELFLPRAEVVYEFDGQKFVDDKLPDEKRVIFGIRPCDCRALALLDRNFDTDEVKDPFYVTRRQNTIVVALGCNQPLSSCFCTALGGGPFGQEGADVLMGDVGDSLLAKAITSKGKDFLTQYGKFFSTAGSVSWDEQAKEARNKMSTAPTLIKPAFDGSELNIENLKSHLDNLFEDEIWETISCKCLGCGACSYLCPVCYCFDLVDEKTASGIKKIRTWDCCMFSMFTHHASGHNPRSANFARLRQKIMHKFNYYTERYGVNGCVGCGRCIRSCPVNLDIRQVLEEIAAAPSATKEK
jgi:ferredoxin